MSRARSRPERSVHARGAAVAPAFAFGGIVAAQMGSATVAVLVERLSAGAVATLRFWLAGIVLVLLHRPVLRRYDREQRRVVAAVAVCMAVLGEATTLALERLPLGASATYMFVGPLGVALATSRRARDVAWVALAAAGILLLSRGRIDTDAVGIALALAAGIGWAGYIVGTARLGGRFAAGDGQAVAIAGAALLTIPFAFITPRAAGLAEPTTWALFVAGGALALPAAVQLELAALRRMPARVFGVLMSLEPAVAAVIGLVLLGQALAPGELAGIACVTLASAGAAAGAPVVRAPGPA